MHAERELAAAALVGRLRVELLEQRLHQPVGAAAQRVLEDRVGDTFDGVVSGVTSFGLFVTLGGIYSEGLVHITALGNDYYHIDPDHHRLTGERTRQVFRLGDALQVQVTRVDLDERKIDLVPV